jgi:RNA polymerase sigma factor for flagellar operon FliA
MALYYFEEMRLREIAEAFGVTESRICQIHTQALQTLRTFLKRYEAVAV